MPRKGVGLVACLGATVLQTDAASGSLRGACAPSYGACQTSKCCATEGFHCYKITDWLAQCRENCTAGEHHLEHEGLYHGAWSCEMLETELAPDIAMAPAPIPMPAPLPYHAPAPLPTMDLGFNRSRLGNRSSLMNSTLQNRTSDKKKYDPSPGKYTLDWKAEGEDFFGDFDFIWEDHNHGASHFVGSLEEAQKHEVVETTSNRAVMRSGKKSKYNLKRMSAKISTKKSWKHFLAAVKFNHVPWGCGVWPAFFTLGEGATWPEGGEMDILEYVNDQGSMTSFHTSKECKLKSEEVNKYKPLFDSNAAFNGERYNCLTKYCDTCTSLGCAPNQTPLLTGQQWANRPGTFVMERAELFTKIFFIPEGQEPHELVADGGEPKPEEWDKWIIAYYPFGASEESCPNPDDVMAKQKFIFQIAFCGDWASKVWGDSNACRWTGPHFNETATKEKLAINTSEHPGQCRAVDPLAEYAPAQDCCTQFIRDEDNRYHTENYLQDRAYFDISWFKVFV